MKQTEKPDDMEKVLNYSKVPPEVTYRPPMDLESIEYEIITATKLFIANRESNKNQKITLSHLKLNGIPEEDLAGALTAVDAIDRITQKLGRHVEKLVKDHPIHPWILGVKGVSGKQFAELLYLVGPLWKYPNPGKLIARLGLHVQEIKQAGKMVGVSIRPKKGEFLGYNSKCKGWAFNMGESMVKQGVYYRKLYDKKKAEYMKRKPTGPSECRFGQVHYKKGGKEIRLCASNKSETAMAERHVEMAARRYAVKKLIMDMWGAYQRLVDTGQDALNNKRLEDKYGVVLDHLPGEGRVAAGG